MISGSNDPKVWERKLKELEVRLGGVNKDNKNKNTFENILTELKGLTTEIKEKIVQLSSNKLIKTEKIKLKYESCFKLENDYSDLIFSLKKEIKNQENSKKFTEEDINNKKKNVEKFKKIKDNLLKILKNKYESDKYINSNKPIKLHELELNKEDNSKNSDNDSYQFEDEDNDIIKEFDKIDNIIDDVLDEINVMLVNIKEKVQIGNIHIKNRNKNLDEVGKIINKDNTHLNIENERLKLVIKKYNSNGKCCIHVVLFLLLIALFYVLIKSIIRLV